MPPLILASTSPRRHELLSSLGIAFEAVPPAFEEDQPTQFESEAAVVDWVRETALHKARSIAERQPRECWVLGADTIVVLGTEVFHKPADEDDAVAMLSRLQGRTHTVMTGVALVQGDGAGERADVAQTQVTFFPLQQSELERYVAAGESLDKAGAYAAQGRGALIIERIDGDYFNVVGLPLAVVARMLGDVGIDVWPPANGAAGEPQR